MCLSFTLVSPRTPGKSCGECETAGELAAAPRIPADGPKLLGLEEGPSAPAL